MHREEITERLEAAAGMIEKAKEALYPLSEVEQVFVIYRMLNHISDDLREVKTKYQEGDKSAVRATE